MGQCSGSDSGQWLFLPGASRPFAFPFESELIGRSPGVVIGKWSNVGAVAKKLTD
jgi:hypothetical protein